MDALNDPTRPQRIEPHRRLCRVAYATARKDFLDLERAGYLERVQESRAFAFVASERLLASYGS